MSVSLTPPMFLQFFVPGTNQPAVGSQLFTYIAGTSTKQATWTDSTQITQSANPIVADGNGVMIFWLDPTLLYKFVWAAKGDTDPPSSPIYSVDNLSGMLTVAALTQAILGPILYPRTAAEISAGVTPVNFAYLPFYVERYGADPTGVADSGAAFRNACLVAAQAGGGKIYALGALYNFTTWDTVSFQATNNLALFCIPGNTELVGGGMFSTKLRISATARAGMYASGANRTHIIGMRTGQTGQYIHDIQFDYNGIIQQSATDFCYFVRTMSGGCTIERTYGIQAPITNGFVDSSGNTGQPVILRRNWWQDCGCNMTGNAINGDISYAYIQAPNSVAEYNLFYNTAKAVNNCGGIEMHSARYYARNNMLRNLWPGMYLGVQDGVTISYGSVVESNYIGFCQGGINIIDQHFGLKITKNFFEANVDSGGGGFGAQFGDIFTPINGTTGQNSAGTQTALSIIDNTFDMVAYIQGTSRSGNGSNSINLGTLTGCKIAQNHFIAATPNAIIINGSSATTGSNGAAGATIDVTIESNDFENCTDAVGTVGYINIFATSAAGWGTGTLLQDVYIRNNHLWRNRSLAQSSAFCLVATGGGSFNPTYTNVRFENNDLVLINPATTVIGGGASVIVNGQSPTSQTISANGQTVATAGVSMARIAPNAAYTGIIMALGTVENQQCTVLNESTTANSVTMAAAGTSNVADGTSCVIAGGTQKTFYWDSVTTLWYHG